MQPSRLALCSLLIAGTAFAAELKPLLNEQALPSQAKPTFKEPLGADWQTAKGKWVPEDGVLHMIDLPEQKHVPVLWHKVGLTAAVIELDFRQNAPGGFLVGCDGAKHVARVVVTPTALSIAEDSVAPSHTIATTKVTAKQGEWHHLRVEWKGDEMAANLDGVELKAKHPYVATEKTRSWLAGTKSADVRNLTINGEKAVTKK
jgi:hypothetical protein